MHGIKNLFSLFFLFCLVMNNSLNAMESNTSIDERMSQEKIVSQMSTRQKLGQMLMMRFRRWAKDGEDNDNNDNFVNVVELNNNIKSIIKDYCIGNIVLFSENFSNEEEDKEKAKEQAKTLVKGFKDLTVDIDIKVDKVKNLNVKIPMIVATDQD
ncbi:MAG: hypothetical protein J6P21_04620 [Clostridia bacterium]|nr:hypothetical protein [Clostridia bacterium]